MDAGVCLSSLVVGLLPLLGTDERRSGFSKARSRHRRCVTFSALPVRTPSLIPSFGQISLHNFRPWFFSAFLLRHWLRCSLPLTNVALSMLGFTAQAWSTNVCGPDGDQ